MLDFTDKPTLKAVFPNVCFYFSTFLFGGLLNYSN